MTAPQLIIDYGLSAALVTLLVGLVTAPFSGRSENSAWSSVLMGFGSASLAITGCVGLANPSNDWAFPRPLWLGAVPMALRLDPLSAFFLLVIGFASLPLALYIPAYMEHLRQRVDMRLFRGALSVLLLSMALVVLAANVQTFLVAWEGMSLSSFLLVATDHRRRSTRSAALIYLGATRVGTAFLAGGFLWAHSFTHTWVFSEWGLRGALALGPGLLILLGLGVKAGMWPFHLWLPIAHPAAPSPVSALMSGVMVKVAIYMMVRLFVLDPALSHPAFGYILLSIGAISAFWGVLFALLQHDLKRLLAYHTVENVGLILIGVGGSLAATDMGLPITALLSIGGALFHVLNHALFKSLLFLGAGAVDFRCHTQDLDRLGGLGQRMAWTFRFFVAGAAAICALPPLNGFASEWLLYQGALGAAESGASPLLRFTSMLMVGWIGLVGALAVACFTKAVAVVFQGRPRSAEANNAYEVPRGMIVAQGSLAIACLALGLGAPLALRALQPVIAVLDPTVSPFITWSVPPGTLCVLLLLTGGAVTAWMSMSERRSRNRTFITWECGFGDLGPRMQIAATSFVQPIARMFGALVRYAVDLHVEGSNRRLFPEAITVEPHTEALLETRVYSPIVRTFVRAGTSLQRLQAGSIHLYLLTMFITLLVLIVVERVSR